MNLYSIAAAMLMMCIATAANAVTMSVSTTAPTVDGADIAQLVGLTDPGGNSGHVWSNRPVHGQTFNTGLNAAGYTLNSVTMLARVDQGSTTSPSWNIRVGTIDLTPNFNLLTSENGAGVTIPQAFPGGNSPPVPQWVTWTFDTPIMLNANTHYAFDVDSSGSGFISLNNPGNVFGSGTAFSSGGGGVPSNPILLHNYDRVFHLDLVAKESVIPEPATAVCALIGIAGLLSRRRRA